jgi:hypothetical protein
VRFVGLPSSNVLKSKVALLLVPTITLNSSPLHSPVLSRTSSAFSRFSTRSVACCIAVLCSYMLVSKFETLEPEVFDARPALIFTCSTIAE